MSPWGRTGRECGISLVKCPSSPGQRDQRWSAPSLSGVHLKTQVVVEYKILRYPKIRRNAGRLRSKHLGRKIKRCVVKLNELMRYGSLSPNRKHATPQLRRAAHHLQLSCSNDLPRVYIKSYLIRSQGARLLAGRLKRQSTLRILPCLADSERSSGCSRSLYVARDLRHCPRA